jgi:hypothetical protein
MDNPVPDRHQLSVQLSQAQPIQQPSQRDIVVRQLDPLLFGGIASSVLKSQQAVRRADPLRLSEQLTGLLLAYAAAQAVERSL